MFDILARLSRCLALVSEDRRLFPQVNQLNFYVKWKLSYIPSRFSETDGF